MSVHVGSEVSSCSRVEDVLCPFLLPTGDMCDNMGMLYLKQLFKDRKLALKVLRIGTLAVERLEGKRTIRVLVLSTMIHASYYVLTPVRS